MRCPKCLSNSAYTGTFTYADDLGVVNEAFCYCTKCKEDITERITDEWIELCIKRPNQSPEREDEGDGGKDKVPGNESQGPRGQSGRVDDATYETGR